MTELTRIKQSGRKKKQTEKTATDDDLLIRQMQNPREDKQESRMFSRDHINAQMVPRVIIFN